MVPLPRVFLSSFSTRFDVFSSFLSPFGFCVFSLWTHCVKGVNCLIFQRGGKRDERKNEERGKRKGRGEENEEREEEKRKASMGNSWREKGDKKNEVIKPFGEKTRFVFKPSIFVKR